MNGNKLLVLALILALIPSCARSPGNASSEPGGVNTGGMNTSHAENRSLPWELNASRGNKTKLAEESEDMRNLKGMNKSLNTSSGKKKENTSAKPEKNDNAEVKLLPPSQNRIYFGAFPDFGGSEDKVSSERIKNFELLAGRKIAWAYFSQNWFNGIRYPEKEIREIAKTGAVPFVRLMPRSVEEENRREKIFTLQKIIDGEFDEELRKWAREAKEDAIPLLVDFGVEMNGDWFGWSGYYNGAGTKDGYGRPDYPDGPERFRDAYRHIIDIFREENATMVTWFFHPDIQSHPEEWWNKPAYYYPGDDYIDWIGVSIYGALSPDEDYWENFSRIVSRNYRGILEISGNKPVALLEFGVTDNHPLGSKAEWLKDAFSTILKRNPLNFSAVSYWHENWEEKDNVMATLRIDSSREALRTFKSEVSNPIFASRAEFGMETDVLNTSDRTEIQNASDGEKGWYRPPPGVSWQWQLSGKINTDYDVDIYDIDLADTPEEIIEELHRKGVKVICYFSAGSWEEFRDDAKDFPGDVIGNALDGWPDERWLDISHYEKFAHIMRNRFDLAVEKGCDGVEPDNVDAYQNDNGFGLSYDDQIRYNRWLAEEAHRRGLSVGLKNELEQVKDLEPYFDFAINEQCFEYDECSMLVPFVTAGKAVLGVEYELEPEEFCIKARKMNFSWLKMDYDLDGRRTACS